MTAKLQNKVRRKTRALLRGQKIIDPSDLLSPARIDIAAKTVFARSYLQDIQSDWPVRVYKEHLRAFNNFYEKEPLKTNFEDFESSFKRTIEGIKSSHGWKHRNPIYINQNYLINGAHRVAASIVLNDKVNTIVPKTIHSDIYNYEFFRKRKNGIEGIDEDVLDYMTIEYVTLKKRNVFAAILFPSAEGHRAEAHDHLSKLGEIINVKKFKSDEFIGKEVIKQLYFDSNNDSWNYGNNFESARNKADLCFDGSGELEVYIIEANLDETTRIKEKKFLRDLWKKDKHSIHITDTIDEANRVVRMFFNKNSRKFMTLERSREFNSDKMYELFNQYIKLAPRDFRQREDFAIEGSAVLDLMNIRTGNDIDYITRSADSQFKTDSIEPHDSSEHVFHQVDIDDILTNPKYYFYYKGFKFVDIQQVKEFKKNRYDANGDEKDATDVHTINRFLSVNKFEARSLEHDATRLPLVSIVIPVYNTTTKLLQKSLDDIRNQKYSDLEVIIVDDGSKPMVGRYLDSYITKHKLEEKWSVIHQANTGLSGARNRGFRQAKGKYIQFLDSDDIFDSNLIHAAVRLAELRDAEVVIENFNIRDYSQGETEHTALNDGSLPQDKLFGLMDLTHDRLSVIPYNVWSKLFKRSFLKENNILHDESLLRAEDLLFTYTALIKSNKIAFMAEPYITYRENVVGSNTATNDMYPDMSIRAWNKLHSILNNDNFENIRSDFNLSLIDSLRWHYSKLNSEEGKIIFATAATDLFSQLDVRQSEFVLECWLKAHRLDWAIDMVELKNEKMIEMRAEMERVMRHVQDLQAAIGIYEQPGVKFATKKLLGASRRKLKRAFYGLRK